MASLTTAAPTQRLVDVGATLAWYRHGASDPTTWSSAGRFVRATLTPDGPGTLAIRWSGRNVDVDVDVDAVVEIDIAIDIEGFGPGGDWLVAQAPTMLGRSDCVDHGLETAANPIVARAAAADRHLRFGASGDLYHELLPTILQQRITIGEAHRQWQRLCQELGEAAPGPFARLSLPPAPDVLARRPSWWFHPLGIERARAEPLVEVARHATKLWSWATLAPEIAADRLRLLHGVGQWTVGSVLGPALGDTDAVAVGDYHLKNLVAHNLAGEARGTDERMLELLAPYAGQRGRVMRLLARNGSPAPKFGPKQRILPMRAW